MGDRRMFQRDGQIDRHVREIEEEFRTGFETVNRIDRPAVSIFGSAGSGGTIPAYGPAEATGRAFADRHSAGIMGGGPNMEAGGLRTEPWRPMLEWTNGEVPDE